MAQTWQGPCLWGCVSATQDGLQVGTRQATGHTHEHGNVGWLLCLGTLRLSPAWQEGAMVVGHLALHATRYT